MQRARLVLAMAIISTFALLCGGLVLAQSARGTLGLSRPDGLLGTFDPTGRSALLFVSGEPNKTTEIVNADLKQVGSVPAHYGRFAVDGMRRFYDVPIHAHRLLVFAPPYQRLATKLDFGEDTPEGVAVDAIHGVVAVPLQQYVDGGGGPLYVNFYNITQSGLTLCDTLQAPGAAGFAPGAFDREGTLYLEDYTNSGVNGIATIAGGCKATTLQFNTIPKQYDLFHSGIYTNSHDDIVVEGGINIVLTFAHPVNGMFGKPIAITTLKFKSEMYFQCLASDSKHLWASPLGERNPKFTEYSYPGGGMPLKQGPLANVYECTPTPPVLP